MLGLEIFVHSVKMVLRNLTQALQISVVPALIGGLLVVGLFFMFGIPLEGISNVPAESSGAVSSGSIAMFIFCAMTVLLIIAFWIIVSWHRFVLLEEYPSGVVPEFRVDRILAYFGRILLFVLLGVIILLPVSFVIGAVAGASALLGIFIWLGLVVLLSVGFYRLSPILPGAAIGKPLTFSQAWAATSGGSGAIVVLVVLSALFQLLIQFLAGMFVVIPVVGPVLVIFAGMLILPLINVSILTTIYGVFIEKRELS
ncbi:membrane protein [Ruegeria sp. ANG-R]|uniref:hypothetical protein n=1 Tax=Ruegeria sp. ANG-R TaxID=1577903 RepID=UPI00057FBC08|nr:hypothetical protein [Ruegeria sp. ANG-R]KIC40385.1 membrane protein [Ruegeria sp. ANG-R]